MNTKNVAIFAMIVAMMLFSGTATAAGHSTYCEGASGHLADYCDSREDLNAETNQFIRQSDTYLTDTGDLEQAEEQLEIIEEEWRSVNRNKYNATFELFDDANSGENPMGYTKAQKISSLEPMSDERISAIQEYNTAMESRYKSAQSGIVVPTAVAMGVGTLLGLIGGVALPRQKFKKVKRKASYTRDLSMGKKQLLLPVIFGIVMLAIGIGIYTVLIGWDTIFTVVP